MDFEKRVNQELAKHKKALKARAMSVVMKKKDRRETYVHARKIWNRHSKLKDQNKYDDAFYCLHLYLRLVLDNQLHKKTGFPQHFEKVADETVANLKLLEHELELCYLGIKAQIRYQFKLEEEKEKGETSTRTPPTRPARPEPVKVINKPLFTDDRDDKPLYPSLDVNRESVGSDAAARFVGTRSNTFQIKYIPSELLRVQKVDGDGHCAFRAIAQGMNHGSLTKETETVQAKEIRKQVAKHLINLRYEEMMETGLTINDVVMMDTSGKHATFTDYVRGMAGSDFAGEMELWIISKALNLKLDIYHQKPGSSGYDHMVAYGEENDGKNVCLLWKRGQYGEGGNHYDALISA